MRGGGAGGHRRAIARAHRRRRSGDRGCGSRRQVSASRSTAWVSPRRERNDGELRIHPRGGARHLRHRLTDFGLGNRELRRHWGDSCPTVPIVVFAALIAPTSASATPSGQRADSASSRRRSPDGGHASCGRQLRRAWPLSARRVAHVAIPPPPFPPRDHKRRPLPPRQHTPHFVTNCGACVGAMFLLTLFRVGHTGTQLTNRAGDTPGEEDGDVQAREYDPGTPSN